MKVFTVFCLMTIIFLLLFLVRDREVELLIDPDTKCEYLTTPLGGLTPRLDRKGNPICE